MNRAAIPGGLCSLKRTEVRKAVFAVKTMGLKIENWVCLVLLTAVIGCHKSATSAQERPATTPAPAVSVSPAAATPAPTQTVLTQPIPVTPPASFTPEQIPQDGPVTFSVSGNAGDLLMVEAKEVINRDYERTLPHTTADTMALRYSISVHLSGTNGSSAQTLQKGGDCSDTSLFLLPETGTYQVVLDASSGHKWGRKYGITFSRFAKDGPVVDPGLKPEQVSIDFGSFSKGEHVQVKPPVVAGGCLDDSGPAHLEVQGKGIGFRIMQAAGYKKVAGYDVFPSKNAISILEAALAAGKTDAVESLPYATSGDAGLNMWARQEVLVGDGWRGLRWIGFYGQEPACRPYVHYFFEGITNDGRFLIVSDSGISHPSTQQRWSKDCISDADNEAAVDAKVHEINALLAKDLDAADPASFQPNLDQLDAVVRSLKFKY